LEGLKGMDFTIGMVRVEEFLMTFQNSFFEDKLAT
jgi:hypothetical protein